MAGFVPGVKVRQLERNLREIPHSDGECRRSVGAEKARTADHSPLSSESEGIRTNLSRINLGLQNVWLALELEIRDPHPEAVGRGDYEAAVRGYGDRPVVLPAVTA